MEILVRLADVPDAPDLARIGASTFAMACPPNTSAADLDAYIQSELNAQRFVAHMQCKSNFLYAALANGSVAGYVMLCCAEAPHQISAEAALELRRLYVAPEFHGRGVALALMKQAYEKSAAAGYTGLWLGVSKQNARGIAFYQKTGFQIVGEHRFRVGADLQEDYLMVSEHRSPFLPSAQSS